MSKMKYEGLEHAATLQLVEGIGKAFVELAEVDFVEDLSVLCVTGDRLDAVQIHQALVFSPGLKSQERRFLERKHRKGCHQTIGLRVNSTGSAAGIGNRLETLAQPLNEGVDRQILADPRDSR